MSFYYRVFTTVEKNIWANEIEAFLEKEDVGFTLCGVVEEEDSDNLEAKPVELILFDKDDNEVASLVYDTLEDSTVLPEEIEEFHEFVDAMEPECNRSWVHNQLSKTVGCYCFTLFDDAFGMANWDRLSTLTCWLRQETEGIEQSDGGQITNEEGAVVLLVPDDCVDEDLDDEEEDETSESDAADEFEDDIDDSESGDEEEEDDVEEFAAAIRVGDKWVDKDVNSEETLAEFMRGEV